MIETICLQGDTMSDNKTPEHFEWKMHIQESIGTLFLGILCIMLIIFWKKSEERNKSLMLELMNRR
jgi:hypothetical protein